MESLNDDCSNFPGQLFSELFS